MQLLVQPIFKALFYVSAIALLLSACNSPERNETERQEDQAERTAKQMKKASEGTDTTAIVE